MPGHTGTRTLALQNAERSHGSRRGVRKHCEKFRSQDFEGCGTPAVVAMTVNRLRRVPVAVEQASFSHWETFDNLAIQRTFPGALGPDH